MRELEIPTMGDTLADQEHLDSLCRDRKLATVEIFEGNAYYGHDLILKRYAGVSAVRALKILMPHGVECVTVRAGKRNLVPVMVHYAEGRGALYRGMGVEHVWRIASPYVHMQALCHQEPLPERQGTLFFPPHSNDACEAQFDADRVLRALADLPEARQPVTVCSYWEDYRNGRHLPFADAGMRVVSAGHIFDPRFLFRFHHLCLNHRYAASNEVGSHAFYAIASGCAYFHLDIEATWTNWTRTKDDPVRLAAHRQLLAFGSTPREEQVEAADRLLGRSVLTSPVELRRRLDRAERIDRLGLARSPNGGRPVVGLPWVLKRRGWAVARRAAQVASEAKSRSGGTNR